MAVSRTHKLEIEQRRVQVAALYLRGQTQSAIGSTLGVTQKTVSNDLSALLAQWRAEALGDTDELRLRELEKINELERTYWTAWEESRGTAKRLTAAKSEGGDRTQVTTEERAGDPRFLSGVERCIERRCKLLGLDAPERVVHGGRIDIVFERTLTDADAE